MGTNLSTVQDTNVSQQNTMYPPQQNTIYPPKQTTMYPPQQNTIYPPKQTIMYAPKQTTTIYPTKQTNFPPQKKGQVIAFHTSQNWKIYFEAAKQTSKLIVIDFTASWCKPCQLIQPAFSDFAERYADVEFIKIDVDQLEKVAEGFGVQVLPTFILIKGGKEVDRVKGVKREELQKKIEKHRF